MVMIVSQAAGAAGITVEYQLVAILFQKVCKMISLRQVISTS